MAKPNGHKRSNPYVEALSADLYAAPKAVLAAIAASALTCGGDWIEEADTRMRREWWALFNAGVVPQRPPFACPEAEG